MNIWKTLRTFLFTVVLAAATVPALTLTGCEDEGPAEETGERLDEAAEETGEAIEETADEVEDEMD